MKQPNRMAIYARKSKLTSQGESIDNQIEMCKEYIQRNFSAEELEINVYEDEGISGKTLDRPEFKSMMKEEQNNPYDYIVVYKLDRISRSVSDFADLIEKFNSLNTSFISVTENFDTSTPIGRAMMSIAAVFAQLERETIAERINDNVSLETLDSLVLNEVFSYNIDGNSINRQFAELRKKIDNIEENIANKIKNLRHRKSENEKVIKNIITNMTKGLFDENTLKIFNDEINRYKEENDSLDIKIAELEDKNKIKSEMNDNVDKMENAIEYLRDNFDSLSINNKRYFIKSIIEKVIWDGETVNIYIKGNDDNSEVTTAIYVSAIHQQQLRLRKL